MKSEPEAPGLSEAIRAHARSLVSGDLSAANRFLMHPAGEAQREAMKSVGGGDPVEYVEYKELGRAKIGFQYVSKLRLVGPSGRLVLLNRWKRLDDGEWRIVEVENLGARGSGWSTIPPLTPSLRENRDA